MKETSLRLVVLVYVASEAYLKFAGVLEMRHLDRLIATAIIWGAFTAIMIASSASHDGFIVVVLAIAAAASTSTMWESIGKEGRRGAELSEGERVRIAKHKRDEQSAASRLMDVLDDEEREEIMRRLSAQNDGELVDLDSLLRNN